MVLVAAVVVAAVVDLNVAGLVALVVLIAAVVVAAAAAEVAVVVVDAETAVVTVEIAVVALADVTSLLRFTVLDRLTRCEASEFCMITGSLKGTVFYSLCVV